MLSKASQGELQFQVKEVAQSADLIYSLGHQFLYGMFCLGSGVLAYGSYVRGDTVLVNWLGEHSCFSTPVLAAACGGLQGNARSYKMEIKMVNLKTKIVKFNNSKHRNQVANLWQTIFDYKAAHNSPEITIDNKIKNKDGLFFVVEIKQRVIGTVMAGYDGHRGWIYSLAVDPKFQRQGIGSNLLSFIQGKLIDIGCLKVNLQILEENKAVHRFYLTNGFSVEKRVSMGKKLLLKHQ